MDIPKTIKSFFGKEKTPRKYQVPNGLADRILYLLDQEKVTGGWRAKHALWKLLGERCPETKEGKWKVLLDGDVLFVRELIS